MSIHRDPIYFRCGVVCRFPERDMVKVERAGCEVLARLLGALDPVLVLERYRRCKFIASKN